MLHQALDNETPKEVFTSVKPNVFHICIPGCPIYFHVPKDKRKKLEVTGRIGSFVGYCENSKALGIYILGQRKVEISRNVTFDEDATLGKAKMMLWKHKKILSLSPVLLMNPWIPWTPWILLHVIPLPGRDHFDFVIHYRMLRDMSLP